MEPAHSPHVDAFPHCLLEIPVDGGWKSSLLLLILVLTLLGAGREAQIFLGALLPAPSPNAPERSRCCTGSIRYPRAKQLWLPLTSSRRD